MPGTVRFGALKAEMKYLMCVISFACPDPVPQPQRGVSEQFPGRVQGVRRTLRLPEACQVPSIITSLSICILLLFSFNV